MAMQEGFRHDWVLPSSYSSRAYEARESGGSVVGEGHEVGVTIGVV